ncbi:MAG: hypothetical protein LBE58_00925 [Comamonas sp.]|jgi:hypothetical protein|uniref:Ig-like domain-containing protein n=1 Tax=Comamonas koreensis TaxID=160825 RepID=A0AAW4XS99_9BURK|nr:hypothetical protein [Comamonas koreensis]MCD2163918.1 hypothetical protein [Comamonas koreensis]MDR2328140.1 hypothetical protein [Comamonas sp.]
MPQRDATTAARAVLQAACAPLSAGLVLLACGTMGPANAVIITVNDSAATTNYALSLQVGSASGTDTVQFNVSGNNAGLTPTAVTGSPAIDISVTPVRPFVASEVARPVTLRVDSSAGLVCQSGPCGTTVIPFSKISWTVSNSSGSAAGDIQSGQFTGATNQQLASFNANASFCSIPIIVLCLGTWTYQSRNLNATRMTFSYANDTFYPAGTYRGTVYFTASME